MASTRGLARGERTATSFAPRLPVSRNSPVYAPSFVGRMLKCRLSVFTCSVARVLSGWTAPGLLDTYETERRVVAEHDVIRSIDPDGSRRAVLGEL